MGFCAAYNVTTGNSNVALGESALFTATTGFQNVAIGHLALNKYTGSANVAVGNQALEDATTGNNNTCVGHDCGREITTATDNTAIGFNALSSNVTGADNTCVGQSAGQNITGYRNTCVGNLAGDSITSGYRNTMIGDIAGEVLTTGNDNTCIGYNAQAAAVDSTNSFTFGDSNISVIRCNTTSISSLSDVRDKTDIVDLPLGVDFLNKLRPVKFKWERRTPDKNDGKIRAGFIAQELQVAQSDCKYVDLVLEDNPDKLEATPGNLIPVLVNAVKELSTKNDELAAEIATLKSQINN